MKTIGIISDTHGLLRPEALAALEGVDLIVHAGDIGGPDIIPQLQRIAPVYAIRGNVDRPAWTSELSETQIVEAGELLIYVLHDLQQIDLDPAAAGFHFVVYGHTHEPAVRQTQGVIYLNPGSIGPRRFRLPVAMARIIVGADEREPNAPPANAPPAKARPTNGYAFTAGEISIEVEMITLEA